MINSISKKALIVEDDVALRQTLSEQLELQEGYIVVEADTGEQALDLCKTQSFEVILMDVGLPDTDGRDLCRVMRRMGIKAPIVIMSAHHTDADAILGLDSGASDYVAKPFRMGVLLARLRAHHRQFKFLDDVNLPIGPYAFRPSTKILTNRETEKKVHLTEREADILKYLYRLGDRPAPRKMLLGEVWGFKTNVTTHTLESHIYRLRQKLEPDPRNAQILVTEPEGYRLVR